MGKRQRNRLTALEVVRQKRTGKHGDGGGLYLVIDDLGRRRWVFIYTMAGKRREMGLGAASGPDVVTLADARAAASAANTLKRQDIDPLDHKKSKVDAIASLKGVKSHPTSTPPVKASNVLHLLRDS